MVAWRVEQRELGERGGRGRGRLQWVDRPPPCLCSC
ncbi:unnamed protein product [Ixodes pacificus]